MPAAAVEARQIVKTFGAGSEAFNALDSVSVTIQQNEFFTLLGPSGCGKTTLLRMIAGFELPTGGDILLEGEPVGHLPPFQRRVNTVFQSYALFPHMSIAENIGFGLEMLGRSKAEIRQRVDQMLALVKLESMGGRKPAQLSGGQQQRVALARALASSPKVLLLDEPLSALDLKLRKEMQIELKRLQMETGITFIFVTHDQEEALTMSDRIAVMSKGQILQIGSPTDIYERPANRFVADFIGETNFITAELVQRDGARATLRIAGAATVDCDMRDNPAMAGTVTIAIRPERLELTHAGDADAMLPGTVENIVYFGTDTTFYVRLADNSLMTVRYQNRHGAFFPHAAGEAVGLKVDTQALQVLKD